LPSFGKNHRTLPILQVGTGNSSRLRKHKLVRQQPQRKSLKKPERLVKPLRRRTLPRFPEECSLRLLWFEHKSSRLPLLSHHSPLRCCWETETARLSCFGGGFFTASAFLRTARCVKLPAPGLHGFLTLDLRYLDERWRSYGSSMTVKLHLSARSDCLWTVRVLHT